MAVMQDLEERLLRNVIVDENGCWLWQRHITETGYGQTSIGSHTLGNRQNVGAHRVSYEHFKGKIPVGLQIDHLCKVRNCINPSHLEAVTPKENIARSNGLPKQEAARTHCPRGHEYTEDNTYRSKLWNGSIGRHCKACGTIRSKAQWQARKLDRMIGV